MKTLKISLLTVLLATTALPAAAEDTQIEGSSLYDSTTEILPKGKNIETTVAPRLKGERFSISVDGEHVAGTRAPEDAQRKTDLGLEQADIQVKYDGLGVKPILNVSTLPVRQSYQPGERVNFLASFNYGGWLERAEIRVFEKDERGLSPPIAKVPVTPEGAASWTMPKTGNGRYFYVLRVYDGEGRWDETAPLDLTRSLKQFATQSPEDGPQAVAPGHGEDRTAVRNIPVYGGAVTVYGRNIPDGQMVTVLGDLVPVDPDGSFVVQRLLPPGDHSVDVEIQSNGNTGLSFNRTINIPSNEWFYVALADFTVGKRFGSGDIEAVKPGEFDDVYTKGRIAFYLKGKIKGQYLLTAAADTGEEPLKRMLKNLDAKDPRQFLRRIDPDDYYPVYGDDSTAVEDAPTRGKFYVRLERGDSHVMWGNFKTEIRGTEFLRNERALYGANGVYRSEEATNFGERKSVMQVYAAQPGTLPQRDVLRGTGGSAYFLKHQDITLGSETLTVEIRDRITGRVLERRQMTFGEDYTIDYTQGVVILTSPLSSTASGGEVVRDGALDSNDVFLIANYEYTPAAGEVDGYVFGGRAEQWIGDHARVGVTGATEKTGEADQKLAGADILIRKSDATFVEAEIARSKGPGFGNTISTDGGVTINDVPGVGRRGATSDAVRVRGRASLDELLQGAVGGELDAYFESIEGGFSSLDRQIKEDETKWGAKARIAASDHVDLLLAFDSFRSDDGRSDRELNAGIEVEASEDWTVAAGVKHRLADAPARLIDGSRTDVGGKITRHFGEVDSIYVFGQATVDRDGKVRRNDRVGVGGTKTLNDKTSLNLEGSYGSGGIGAAATVDYKPTADDHYYFGYKLDPDRAFGFDQTLALQGDDLGTIVAGARRKHSEQLSLFAEDSYDLFGQKRSLTQAYGVTYTPLPEWTFGASLESGEVWDDTVDDLTGIKASDFDRTAISLQAGWKPSEKADGRIKGEVRFEDSDDNTRDVTSYYFGSGFRYNVSDDWRLLISLDAVIADATETVRDGEYVEGSVGYAYRPTTNDRLNALFKYTFLYDNPGFDQVTAAGRRGPSQLSHIVSVDASYDVTQLLSIGGKYGFRIGETKERDAGAGWEDSSAHIAILRADLHVEKNWDVLLEGRVLWSPETDAADFGALAAVYRHVGENFKAGVGYNFGRFSDDLRDLKADDHGVFLNLIGQF
jgi:hypothetical protein